MAVKREAIFLTTVEEVNPVGMSTIKKKKTEGGSDDKDGTASTLSTP